MRRQIKHTFYDIRVITIGDIEDVLAETFGVETAELIRQKESEGFSTFSALQKVLSPCILTDYVETYIRVGTKDEGGYLTEYVAIPFKDRLVIVMEYGGEDKELHEKTCAMLLDLFLGCTVSCMDDEVLLKRNYLTLRPFHSPDAEYSFVTAQLIDDSYVSKVVFTQQMLMQKTTYYAVDAKKLQKCYV